MLRSPRSGFHNLTGAIETAEEFGKRIYLEAWNRGWRRASKKVVMGDGDDWIWNLAVELLPAQTYHASGLARESRLMFL
jgi:hypothetical protein